MKDLADSPGIRKFPVRLLIFGGLSVLVGSLIGNWVPFGTSMIFCLIVIVNTIVVTFLVLQRNMTYGVFLYIYALIFLNLYWRVALPGRVPDMDVPRLVFSFIWLIFLLEVGLGQRRVAPRTNIESAMLAMMAVLLFSMLVIGKSHIRLFLNGYAIPYSMFVIGKNIFRTREDALRLVYWVAVPLSVYFPVNHFFEHAGMRQFVFPRYIMDPNIGGQALHFGERTIGAFLQPVVTGLAMITMFVLSLYGLSRLKSNLARALAWGITAITPMGVFLIYSRGAYAGFFMALMVLLVFSKKLKMYALVILLAATLMVLGNWSNVKTTDRTQGGVADDTTARGRLVMLQASMSMFKDRPFIGVGFLEFTNYSRPYIRQVRMTLLGMRESWMGKRAGQHNHFLTTVTELGLLGLIPELLMFYWIFWHLIKARKRHDDGVEHDFVVVVLALFTSYVTMSTFMEPKYFEFMNAIPFMMAGIVVGSYQRNKLGIGKLTDLKGAQA